MLKKLIQIFCVLYFISSSIYGQMHIDFSNISTEDIIEALAFSGIGIFNFEIDSLRAKNKFYLLLEEYAGKDNLLKIDTLLGQKPFEIESGYVDKIRIISKIENNSFDKIHLYITTPVLSTWKDITIGQKYNRKHYWIKFEKTKVDSYKRIPLLFFASEWDTFFNGEKTTRFCSTPEIPVDLSGDAILETPHFYIVSYLIK